MQLETRRHVRYKVKDGTLAALSVPGKLKLTIGPVLDISKGGLALMHTDEISAEPEKAELVLLGHDESKTSELRFPARFIYRQKLQKGYRSGFEFKNLSGDQISLLASFIESNSSSAISVEPVLH